MVAFLEEGRPGICELTVIASYKSIDVGWNVLRRFTFDAGHLVFVKQCIFRTKNPTVQNNIWYIFYPISPKSTFR